MPDASVIVPARDAAATLGRTLECLAAQRFEGSFEVVVVDDGSSDATRELVRRAGVGLLTQEALGPAAARNRGVAATTAPALAFCDADCFPTPGWLSAGVRALAGADLVQGRVIADPDAPLGPFDRTLWVPREVGLYETANLFVTRRTFDRIGGFEEWLRPRVGKAVAEDVWFGWRARRAGARSAFASEALAHHAVFPRGARDYVLERRRLRYFPAMVRKMPELRDQLLHRRLFLNRRSAAFDAALVGLAVAGARRSPLALAAVLPYARLLGQRGLRAGRRRAPEVIAADVAADVLGAVELLHGSARYGSPVL